MKLTRGYIIVVLSLISMIATTLVGQINVQDSSSLYIDSIINHFHNLAWEVNTINPELSQSYLDSASKYTTKTNQSAVLAQILEIKGSLYLANAKYREASWAYKQSINLYNQIPELKHRSGYVQIELGTIFYKLGEYREALQSYETAIPQFNTTDNLNESYGKSLAHNNIGLCYSNLGDYHTALKSFNEALQYRRSLKQDELVAHSYGYLADTYINLGEYQKADSIINMGLELPVSTNNIWRKKLELNKGHLKTLQGHTNQAREVLESTGNFIYLNNQKELYNELNQTLTELEFKAGNYSQANFYAERGYKENFKARNYTGAIDFVNLSKNIALQQNDLKKALYYSDKTSALKDSFIAANRTALKELLEVSSEMAQTQIRNTELQSTTSEYSGVIEDQKGLLVASTILILLLLLVAYIVTRLNNKLKANQKYQRELNLRILAVINRTESLIISLGPAGSVRVINKPGVNFFKKWINVEISAGDILLEKLKGTAAFATWEQIIKKSKSTHHWKEVSQFVINKHTSYFLENFSAITHKDGTYAGLVVVSNDITKEHEYNVQMSEQNNNLEKSNKAKERMLSILAHDLKDAVYSAHSLSELVLETPEEFPKEELIHLFSLLHGNFDKTKSLLDGLLDWMRTQTGGLEINQTSFVLRELVIEVFETCYTKSVSKKIGLSMEIPADLTISGDREMIKTVLRNLVNNAIKYTQPGKGKVTIFTQAEEDKVSIHVKDNGQGISEENQKKLFQGPGKFTTVGTANEQGTGFGLNLCKELVHLHKSKLCLSSKEGHGTDFFFQLPLANKKDQPKKQLH